MRFKYLIPMVLGAMLIMTATPAFALPVGDIGTQVDNGLSVSVTSGSGNTYSVNTGDTLSWQNTLYNNDATDSTVYCGIDGSDPWTWSTTTYHQSKGQIVYHQNYDPYSTSVQMTASSGYLYKSHKYSTNSNPFINSHGAGYYDTLN